jgi:uncharacterized protein with GYD domain
MPTYVSLNKWTAKGFANIQDSPARLDRVKAAAREVGGELKTFYMTMGDYDMVVIWEAPDDETYGKLVLKVMSEGFVEGHSLKAFTEEEYRRMVGS